MAKHPRNAIGRAQFRRALDTGDADIARIFIEIKKWYTTIVSDLATRLSMFPTSEGRTALDDSLVVWGNELATGPHALTDIPVVLLGGAGGKLQRTGYLVDAGPQPHQRLGATLLNIMGVKAAGFGGLTDCGTLDGLDSRCDSSSIVPRREPL